MPTAVRRAAAATVSAGPGASVALGVLAAGLWLAGCSPALDWREVRSPGTAVVVTLPCKPNASARPVQLAGQTVRLAMLACKAEDLTWALASADVTDPALVGPALLALREGTRANLQGQVVETVPVAVRGATPHDGQVRVRVQGRKQDGTATSARLIVFSHGTQVFQAIVMGARWPDGAVDTFFESLRVGP
jgi:hypothetical protein